MRKNKFTLFAIAASVLMMAGCTMAPKYERPQSPVPSEWPAGQAYDPTKVTKEDVTAGEDVLNLRWRDFFTDPKLKEVIGIALENNRQLKGAALNVEYYRKLYHIQAEGLLPVINATGSISRARVPADLSGTGRRMTTERDDVGLGAASWEIDFFGRIRSLKDAAMQEYLATEQAQRSAQISVISAIAQTYLMLAADKECYDINQNLVKDYRKTYDLVKNNYDLGLVSEIDLSRTASQVAASERAAATYLQSYAQDKNQLDFLAGTEVPAELLPDSLTSLNPSREICAGLSTDILLKRPDILEAEHQLLAANANIGAARAAYFPRISLTAAIGSASSELSGLFKSGSGYWSYAPQVVLPIFDTRTWSSHKASKVKKEMMINSYEEAIQSAFREVADVLAILGTVDRQLAAQQAYVDSVKKTYELTEFRYESNLDSSLSVLDAQRSLRGAQDTLVAMYLQKQVNHIRLYTVLDGGWDPEEDAENTGETPADDENTAEQK